VIMLVLVMTMVSQAMGFGAAPVHYCDAENHDNIDWPRTRGGATAELNCPDGQEGHIRRQCGPQGDWSNQWEMHCNSPPPECVADCAWETADGQLNCPYDCDTSACPVNGTETTPSKADIDEFISLGCPWCNETCEQRNCSDIPEAETLCRYCDATSMCNGGSEDFPYSSSESGSGSGSSGSSTVECLTFEDDGKPCIRADGELGECKTHDWGTYCGPSDQDLPGEGGSWSSASSWGGNAGGNSWGMGGSSYNSGGNSWGMGGSSYYSGGNSWGMGGSSYNSGGNSWGMGGSWGK